MVLGGDGAVIMLVLAGLLLVRQFRTDIGSDSGLVDLFLLVEKFFLFFFGFLFVEALPLPFVKTETTRTKRQGGRREKIYRE